MLSEGSTMLSQVPTMLSEDPNLYHALRAAMLLEVPTMLSVSAKGPPGNWYQGPYGIRGPTFLYII